MRILFVTPYVPSIVRIRPYAFIRELAARGHEITLACLVQPAREDRYLEDVGQYCCEVYPVYLERFEPQRNLLASLPTGRPMSVAYCRSRRMIALVQELVEGGHFDLAHTEFVRAVPYTAELNGCPKVYDTVDSLVLTYRRTLSAPYVSLSRRLIVVAELLKMYRFEHQALRHYDRVLVSSPADRDALGRAKGDGITVIPNGVDVGFFDYRERGRSDDTIVFLGKMSYHVNVASILWFYHRVFTLIRRQRPGVELKVVGRDPVSKIEALSADAAVEVTGSVPDVRPHLAQAAVSICPMVTGAGIQNKMLEAMAVGAPTVSTSIACQAVKAEPGRDLLVADEPVDFAEAVLRLLADGPLRCRLAANARRYVEEHHDWETLGRQLEDVYRSLVN